MPTVTWSLATNTTASLVGGNFGAAGNGTTYDVYVEDVDSGGGGDWYSAGVRVTGAAFSGTVTSATLTLQRIDDHAGANGVVRIKCEDSGNSAAFTSGAPPKDRAVRSAYVDYEFAMNGNDAVIDVTTLIADLASAYSYTGTQSICFILGANNKFGITAIGYRCVAKKAAAGVASMSVTTSAATATSGIVSGGAVHLARNAIYRM